jgi:hypothetical protein
MEATIALRIKLDFTAWISKTRAEGLWVVVQLKFCPG